MTTTLAERARAILRSMDREIRRIEDDREVQTQVAAEGVKMRNERRAEIAADWARRGAQDVVLKLHSAKEVERARQLAAYDDADERSRVCLRELQIAEVKARATYDGAQRMAAEVGLIGWDECPRWQAKEQAQ